MIVVSLPTSLGTLGKYDDVERTPEFALAAVEHTTIKPEVSDQEEYLKTIHNFARKNDFLAVGGDHSVSYGLVKGFRERYPNGKVVIFDAHPDCEVHTDVPTHEDWIRILIEEKTLKPEDVGFVGVRKTTKRERGFMKENGLKNRVPDGEDYYLSIDLDVLNEGDFFFRERGGIGTGELLDAVRSMKPKVRCCDMVEGFPTERMSCIIGEILSILI